MEGERAHISTPGIGYSQTIRDEVLAEQGRELQADRQAWEREQDNLGIPTYNIPLGPRHKSFSSKCITRAKGTTLTLRKVGKILQAAESRALSLTICYEISNPE